MRCSLNRVLLGVCCIVIERALQLKSCVLGACCILIERALQFKSYVVGVCYLYLFTHTGVQHDFHIRRCSCR